VSTAWRWSPALLTMFTAAACSVFPKSARPDFFVLTALEPPPTAPPEGSGPTVLVGRVVLPEYLDRTELVTRLTSNQLRVEDLELWAEPLRDSVPRILEQNLASLLGPGQVQRLPWTATTTPDLIVSVELRRFEKTARGSVELAAQWKIATGNSERARRQTQLSYGTGETSTRIAVATLSKALAALSHEIAKDLKRLAHDASR
jgi:uncharacterized protein